MADFYDPSNTQFEKGQKIEIYSIASGETCAFKAWLTDFSDKFESDWTTEEVYGRMDPIQTFKGTKRTISLSWDLVAASKQEAMDNMAECAKLFKMLYPTYEGTTMKASPLVKMKFANLITNSSTSSTSAAPASEAGLTGSIDGFAYSPDLEQGFFEEGGAVYPQTIALECTFIVAHTHDLGWRTDGGERFPSAYPYNQADPESADDAPTQASSAASGAPAGAAGGATAPVGSDERREAEAVEGAL